jgi:hypothetical protein
VPEAAVRAQERLLREVRSILVIASEPVTQPIDRALMPGYQHVEGLAAARQTCCHERTLIELVEHRLGGKGFLTLSHLDRLPEASFAVRISPSAPSRHSTRSPAAERPPRAAT